MRLKNIKPPKRSTCILLAAALILAGSIWSVWSAEPMDRWRVFDTIFSLLLLGILLAVVISFMRTWGTRLDEFEEGELDEAKQLDARL